MKKSNGIVSKWVNKPNESGYFSSHFLVNYRGSQVPEWWIRKLAKDAWEVRAFSTFRGEYMYITGLRPFKTLREAKKYIDIDVQEFKNLR